MIDPEPHIPRLTLVAIMEGILTSNPNMTYIHREPLRNVAHTSKAVQVGSFLEGATCPITQAGLRAAYNAERMTDSGSALAMVPAAFDRAMRALFPRVNAYTSAFTVIVDD